MHVKSAWLPGSPVFVVKVASWFARHGASGVIMAFDAQTGEPVALLRDGHHLSDVRTAAAGALATRLLARDDSATVGVLGTGVTPRWSAWPAAARTDPLLSPPPNVSRPAHWTCPGVDIRVRGVTRWSAMLPRTPGDLDR